jgi:hypothetical protein
MSKPVDPRATWVLPSDELAVRRKKPEPDEPTAILRTLTVQEVEQRLLSADDETRTDIQPILEGSDRDRS